MSEQKNSIINYLEGLKVVEQYAFLTDCETKADELSRIKACTPERLPSLNKLQRFVELFNKLEYKLLKCNSPEDEELYSLSKEFNMMIYGVLETKCSECYSHHFNTLTPKARLKDKYTFHDVFCKDFTFKPFDINGFESFPDDVKNIFFRIYKLFDKLILSKTIKSGSSEDMELFDILVRNIEEDEDEEVMNANFAEAN